MKEYHNIWLKYDPNRSEEWLKEKLKEGFEIHHIDGNHINNEKRNLILIEEFDHHLIHNKKIDFFNKKELQKKV